jgi:DNA-binding protein HU-beta
MATIAAAEAEASKQFNKKDLVTALADQHHLSKRASQKMLDDLIIMITKHLKKGEKVKITGLGILQVRRRVAHMGRNPATGEAIKIKASKRVVFRATKELKMAI